MTFEQSFGEIRSLLDQQPSRMGFDLICQHIDAASADDAQRVTEEWFPYIDGRLESWPDSTRLCPKQLIQKFEDGEPLWGSLVRALDYEGISLTKKRMEKLFALEHASSLTWLDLRSAKMKWDQIESLAADAPFRLKHFGFRRVSKIDWDVIDALFSSPMLSGLESLTFRGWDKIKADIYTHMIEHLPLTNLRVLDLSGGAITSRRLKELLDTGALDQLEELRVGRWVSEKGCTGILEAVAKRSSMTSLQVLHCTEAKTKEFKALRQAEHLSSLRELHIDSTIDLASVEHLVAAPLHALEDLSIYFDKNCANAAFELLRGAKWLDQLHTLNIGWYSYQTEEPARLSVLFDGSSFGSLRRLCLEVESAENLEELAAATHLDKLTDLSLCFAPSSDDARIAAVKLFGAPHIANVTSLILSAQQRCDNLVNALIGSSLLGHCERLRINDASASVIEKLLDHGDFDNVQIFSVPITPTFDGSKILTAICNGQHIRDLRALELSGRYHIEDLLELRQQPDTAFPELMHITCPEYAHLQQHDWF